MQKLLVHCFVATLPLLIGALLWIQPVRAELVDDIYKARLLVDGRDAGSLNQARTAGLLEVLIKASGDPQAAQNPVVVQALG
ncbi:MAG: DUF2066 domain-containing protein, partial [Congregibacter sp.]|nr:DUF2066 domain-containing protein [Congregibacter sp.]